MFHDNDNPELDGPAPTPPEMGMGMPSADICVPLAALGEPDEGQQMQTPEVGNIVTMSVEGTVSRLEGDKAYVTPSAVNGQKLEKPEMPMDEESQLRDQAASMGPASQY